ncbi:MAG: methyltransferase domain-containing protein [Nitrospinales bacterium]
MAESLEALSTEHQVFKIIVLNQVTEYFRNPLDSLKMIAHVSSRDVFLLTSTADSASLKARIKGPNWDKLRNRTHLHLFTKKNSHFDFVKKRLAKCKNYCRYNKLPASRNSSEACSSLTK